MSSPVDVPGRSLPNDLSTISTSPNELSSYIDCAFSPNNYNMHITDVLNKPDCPFPLISGEVLEEVAEFPGSKGYLTNYRFIILYDPRSPIKVESIAIGNIDAIDSSQNSDMLHILCKDARVIRVQTSSLEQALQWYKKLTALALPRPAPSLFALTFSKSMQGKTDANWCNKESTPEYTIDEQELFTRWGMDPDYFAVVDYNADYSICSSYPRDLMVPKSMDKREIEMLRDYRMLGRIPAVVWHCPENNVLLLRASQPKPALLNWRSDKDEKFLRLVTEYTSAKRGVENSGKIKIFDCRSYMATLGNRIKGGGSEREEHYANMKLEYCNLPNIHNVRYTFDALRKLFNPPVDQSTFLSSLQATNWLSTIMSILSYSNKAAEQLEKGRNVLIHCSDGWDRTTQLVTLVKILVDPYYRTIAGLEELIRRDWIGYGHKFSDRNGISGNDGNERCPVFLQWLDALHQVHAKFPHRFEYSMAYLVKLAAHTSSGLFTSFCFNTVQEMESVLEKEGAAPFPIWRMLNSDKCYENALYDREAPKMRLLAPDNMQGMRLWNEVYRCQDVVSLLSTNDEERAAAEGGTGGGTRSEYRETRREGSSMLASILPRTLYAALPALIVSPPTEESEQHESTESTEEKAREEEGEGRESRGSTHDYSMLEDSESAKREGKREGEEEEKDESAVCEVRDKKNTVESDENEESCVVESESGECVQATSVERESNGMERSMVKSRSSESIASTSESQMFPSTPVNPLRATESDEEGEARERRGTRSSIGSGEGVGMGGVGGREGRETVNGPVTLPSVPPPSPDVRPLLDYDGLVRFVDPTQETARKKFAEYEENATKKEETERQRMRSEMSDVSIGGRGDDEPFQMDDLMSDASIVDEHELVYTPKHVGTQVHATHCSVCRHPFNLMNSKLNCHSCGRAVCHRCSSHSYMETTDGVAKSRKACNECYSKMHSTPTPLTPSHSHSSHSSLHSASGTRSCPDGEATPSTSYVSPSQAVKG